MVRPRAGVGAPPRGRLIYSLKLSAFLLSSSFRVANRIFALHRNSRSSGNSTWSRCCHSWSVRSSRRTLYPFLGGIGTPYCLVFFLHESFPRQHSIAGSNVPVWWSITGSAPLYLFACCRECSPNAVPTFAEQRPSPPSSCAGHNGSPGHPSRRG